MVYKFKIYFSEKKLPLIEPYQHYQHYQPCKHINISCDFALWKFHALVISLMSEWSIENIALFPCKISAFNKKYF